MGLLLEEEDLCGCERKERFTTFERVQFQELTVIKKVAGKENLLIEIKFQNQLELQLEKDQLIQKQ